MKTHRGIIRALVTITLLTIAVSLSFAGIRVPQQPTPSRDSTAQVIIKANPWAFVSWTGRQCGRAEVSNDRDIRIQLEPGTYNFRFENDFYCSENKTVTSKAGMTSTVVMDFESSGRTKMQLGGRRICQ